MIERDSEVSVKRQAQLLDLSRSSVYYAARRLPERDLTLMRILDELHLKWPFYGARKLARELQNQGHKVGRRHVTTLMRRMGMETIYRKPRTSIPAPLSAIYPYLLTGLKIERPNHVWAADLTYLPMAHGFQYLVAIIDVGSRKTLSWRVSNTMTPDFCVEALQEALRKYGKPEIFNTDQGSQFTCGEWIDTLKAAGVQISMDGKGRWIGRVDDWRGSHINRGVAVAGQCRCLNPLHVFRFQSPLVEPDVQISRIRLSRMSLKPSLSPRRPGCQGVGRGRASHRETRSDTGGIRCPASLVSEATIAADGSACISGSPGMHR
jgi:putative transposase